MVQMVSTEEKSCMSTSGDPTCTIPMWRPLMWTLVVSTSSRMSLSLTLVSTIRMRLRMRVMTSASGSWVGLWNWHSLPTLPSLKLSSSLMTRFSMNILSSRRSGNTGMSSSPRSVSNHLVVMPLTRFRRHRVRTRRSTGIWRI